MPPLPSIPATPLGVVVNFDEVAIRPAPQKPFETAESPNRDVLTLSPCVFCGRNFNSTNLSRHVTICERLAHKPKRGAFATVAQRLSHVAQEDSVKSVIRHGLERRPLEDDSAQSDHFLKVKKGGALPSRKKSPAGRSGADLFREQQKGHSKCQYCERTFREEAFDRHVDFCKTQWEAKLRQQGKEDPKSDLLMRRVKYRPPLPRTNSKESPLLPRKALSAFSPQQHKPTGSSPFPSSAARPADLKVLGSQSAIARMNPPGKTPTDIGKLTGKPQGMVLSDYSSGNGNGVRSGSGSGNGGGKTNGSGDLGGGGSGSGSVNGRQRIMTPYQEGTSPSDYGSGESLLSRTGSFRAGKANGISRQVVGSGSGNGTGGSGIGGNGIGIGGNGSGDGHRIYYSGDLLSRSGSVRVKKTADVLGTSSYSSSVLTDTPYVHTGGGYGGAYGGVSKTMEEAIRSNGGKIKLHSTPDTKMTKEFFPKNVSTSADRPYPFNVALAQKEEMMEIHRFNSVRVKNASVDSSSVDWDSFLKPTVFRTPGTPEADKERFFQWDGDRFRPPLQRNLLKLSDFSRQETRINEAAMTRANGDGRYEEQSRMRRDGRQDKPHSSHSESLEETEETDNSSDSVSPISPSLMGSTTSVKSSSAIGSSLSSLNGLQQKTNFVEEKTIQKKCCNSKKPNFFCHNCGNEFPIPNAAFCCHCGMARLITRIPIS